MVINTDIALIELTTQIATAYLKNNSIPSSELPTVIATIHTALSKVGMPEPGTASQEPAVPIKKSVHRDYIICLEDGKKLKMLKRHLRTVYNMTPAEYRTKWGLPSDYPMVAPAYAERRSEFAKSIGLGRKSAPPPPAPAPATRGRRAKAA